MSEVGTRGAPRPASALVVMQSFHEPRPTTNPYIVMLHRSLRASEGLEVHTFSWRRALVGRLDVFHAHWPEILVSGRTEAGKLAHQLLMLLFLARILLTRTAVVRTRHNLELPSGISRRERWLLRGLERLTTWSILLNPTTPVPPGQGSTVVLHGHYRDWFAGCDKPSAIPGRLSYFGLVRNYKGLGPLVDAFRALAGEYSLRIAGKPSSDDLVADLTRRATGDERISFDFRFLSDAELVDVARCGEVVVLPYREMHNSGGVLAALSVDRPVLVPANPLNSRLAEEVGQQWIIRYSGDLTAEALAEAVRVARTIPPDARPDLSARDWDHCGHLHAEAYRAAVRRRGPAAAS